MIRPISSPVCVSKSGHVDEEMDGIAREQRHKLETIESELVDVKRRLGRLYALAETTDLDIEDFKPRIREHRERQERLEATAEEARAMLSRRREVLDDVETITAYALDMSEFLNESELTERRAFIESFVKEIVVMPDIRPWCATNGRQLTTSQPLQSPNPLTRL